MGEVDRRRELGANQSGRMPGGRTILNAADDAAKALEGVGPSVPYDEETEDGVPSWVGDPKQSGSFLFMSAVDAQTRGVPEYYIVTMMDDPKGLAVILGVAAKGESEGMSKPMQQQFVAEFIVRAWRRHSTG
jgi:hypothetical protein